MATNYGERGRLYETGDFARRMAQLQQVIDAAPEKTKGMSKADRALIKDSKKAAKNLKNLKKDMTRMGLDPNNPPEDAVQPTGDLSYTDLIEGMTLPALEVIEAYKTSGDPAKMGIANMMEKMRDIGERAAAMQEDWTAAGNPGQAPQIQEMKAQREMLEQNAVDMGMAPDIKWDDYADDQGALIEDFGLGGIADTEDLNTRLEEDRLRMQEEFNESGALGKFAGIGDDVTQRQSEMMGQGFAEENRGNTIDNLNALMSGVQDQSDLSQGVNTMLTDATQGKLTAPESEWLKNQMAAMEPYIQDSQRSIKEAAGAQRGIGGGRLNKQLAENDDKMRQNLLARLSDMQAGTANQAVGFQTNKRGQDISLANLGAGMQNNVAGIQQGATGAQGQWAGQRSAADFAREQANRTMMTQPLTNITGAQDRYLTNRGTQMSALDKDKDRLIDTFVNPLDKAIDNVMDIQEFRDWQPGRKLTRKAKKQQRAQQKLNKLDARYGSVSNASAAARQTDI